MVSTMATLDYAHLLARHLNSDDLQCAAIAILFELGIPTNRVGFDYLVQAIMLCYENPTLMVTKEIYPAVGRQYETAASSFQIEQAIRGAITAGWKRRDEMVWEFYFAADEEGRLKRPTNSQFISKAAYFLKLMLRCYAKEVCYENR